MYIQWLGHNSGEIVNLNLPLRTRPKNVRTCIENLDPDNASIGGIVHRYILRERLHRDVGRLIRKPDIES